jgi:hypothetical protein
VSWWGKEVVKEVKNSGKKALSGKKLYFNEATLNEMMATTFITFKILIILKTLPKENC